MLVLRLIFVAVLCSAAPARAATEADFYRQMLRLATELVKPEPNNVEEEAETLLRIGEELADLPNERFLQSLDGLNMAFPGGRPDASTQTRRHAVRLEAIRLRALRALRIQDERLERACYALYWMLGTFNDRVRALEHAKCYADAVRVRRGDAANETIEAGFVYADALRSAGRFTEAVSTYQALLAAAQGRTFADPRALSDAWSTLSQAFEALGRFEEQEAALRSSVQVAQVMENTRWDDYLFRLGALIAFYQRWGRDEEAETLIMRGYALANQRAPKEFITGIYAWRAMNIAIQRRQVDEARELLQQGRDIFVSVYGPETLYIGMAEESLALIEEAAGNRPASIDALRRALAHYRKAGGNAASFAANVRRLLANQLFLAGRNAEARTEVDEALKAMNAASSDVLDLNAMYALQLKGRLEYAAGHLDAARHAFSYGFKVIEARLAAVDGLQIDASKLRDNFRGLLTDYLVTLARSGDLAESFKVFQLTRYDLTSATLARTMARAAAADPEMGSRMRAYEQEVRHWRELDQDANGLAASDATRAATLRKQRDELASRLQSTRADLHRRFPKYFEYTANKPVELKEVQRSLRPREALVAFFVEGGVSYGWLIKPTSAHLRFLGADMSKLRAQVRAVRDSVLIDEGQALRPFATETAHALYKELVDPFASWLEDVDHLTVVADDELRSLPFGLLIRSDPKDKPLHAQDWMIHRFALSELPSVGTFRSVRRSAPPGQWRKPFAGFGDPTLAPVRMASALPDVSMLTRGPRMTADDLRRLPSLPDTRGELESMARSLGADPTDSLFLGRQATESRVRSMGLRDYKVLAFATHGLMRDGVRLDEPALVFTPPSTASERDDGLLTASEIATLDMDADWVILSACNTAGPDGGPSSRSLSGLARAFFSAGARALLVSHWYVSSKSTAALTSEVLRNFAATPEDGKAGALRKAMAAMSRTPERAHPALWAPFTLVGDGAG